MEAEAPNVLLMLLGSAVFWIAFGVLLGFLEGKDGAE